MARLTATRLRAPELPARAFVRGARLVALAVIIGWSIANVAFHVAAWNLADMDAYWNAALRLRDGQPLYPALADASAADVYRYAPWFAWLAVPFTFLPAVVAGALWSAILVAASCAAVWPLVQGRAWLLVAFFWPILIGISAIGNVQPLIVAALVLGVERRSGPLWIAAAASLKAVPILFVLVYLGRRQWWRALAALVLTGVLVAPMLLYDLANYPATSADAGLLITWLPVYAVAVLVGTVLTLRLAATRWGWLANATTVVLALPRFFIYDLTFLLAATPRKREP